jgi:hypothetical protein
MAEYNEDAYRQARKAYIEHNCPFERALLSRCVGCSRSRKLNLAEREAIACGDPAVREHCIAFHDALHDNAQFALKISLMGNRPHPTPPPQAGEGANATPQPINAPWPFGKEIRAQCGGVRGLSVALGGAGDEFTNTAEVVLQGLQRFGGCDQFPYSEIMRAVVHYEPRPRRK